jgi:hypothetical protein
MISSSRFKKKSQQNVLRNASPGVVTIAVIVVCKFYLKQLHRISLTATFGMRYYRANYLDFLRIPARNSFTLYSVTGPLKGFVSSQMYKYNQHYFLNYTNCRGIFSLVVTYETQKEISSARYHQLLLYDTSATLSFLHVWRHIPTIGINATGDDIYKLEQRNFELLSYDRLKYS